METALTDVRHCPSPDHTGLRLVFSRILSLFFILIHRPSVIQNTLMSLTEVFRSKQKHQEFRVPQLPKEFKASLDYVRPTSSR